MHGGRIIRKGAAPKSSTLRVLFVDDSQEILDLYEAGLSDMYQVIAVGSGLDAIGRVRKSQDIDAAVIDYMLPDMSGIEVLKEIKDIAPSIPVIIVTAFGDEDVAVNAFRSGARDYLKKPFSLSELCAKIDFFLALRNGGKQARKNVVFERVDGHPAAKPPRTVSFRQYNKIQAAVRYINDNFRTDICLDNVAREVAMSTAHLSRLFRKVMGMSYQDYLNRRRIAKAQNLLRTSAETATDIGLSVGFSDGTGFGRIFKKMTGCTPSAFRNLHRT